MNLEPQQTPAAAVARVPAWPPEAPVNSDAIDGALRAVVGEALAALVERHHLYEVALPDALARAPGQLHGTPVTLHTRRFRGAGLESLTLAALATARGELRSATVIGLPARGTLFPVLGVDAVAIAGALALVALDLAPTDELFWELHGAPVLRAVGALAFPALTCRKRPDFAQGSFSHLAVIAAARPGREVDAAAAASYLLRGAGEMLACASPIVAQRHEHAYARSLQWRAAERRNRKEHDALSRMFGAEFARRYLDEFLFAGC